MMKSLLLAMCGLVVVVSSSLAQSGLSTMGTDFYVPIVVSSAKCEPLEAVRTRQLLVSGFCDTRITVSYFDRTSGKETISDSYSITAAKAATIPLDVSALSSINANGEVPEYISCHVTAEHPVSVHAFSAGPVECYESMVLPTNLLGLDYVVSTFGANTGEHAGTICNRDTAYSMFVIIATRDNTHVTITPSDYTLTNLHDAGKPFSIVLQRGQVYIVKSHKLDEATLDNSQIHSDKPVVVWGANEGADYGWPSLTDPTEERRNVIAQQMLPVRLWSKGPFYTAPLMDPPGLPATDATIGNALLYYVRDSATQLVHRHDDFNFQTFPITPLHSMALHNNTGVAIDSAGRPMMVQVLDYRAENVNYPVATPTLMNVLPAAAAVRSVTFYIPNYAAAAEASSYVTLVLGPSVPFPNLHYWMDGADSGLLLNYVAQYSYHTSRAYTYRFAAGHTYRITADTSFVAYQSNFYGLALSGKVQHGGAGSYFFSCATPIVGRYPAAAGERPRATSAYSCDASWSVTARGSLAAPLGLATVLRDPKGDYVRLAKDSGYASTNIDGTGVLLTPGDTTATFRIAVRNPLADAEAWVQVQNTLGNDTLLHLRYTAPKLTQSLDSISFDNAAVGRDSCATIIYTNVSATDTLRITSLRHSDTSMQISTVPALPVTLEHGQSLSVDVCHIGKIESRRDTLHLVLACGEARVPIHAISAKTTMTANDHAFGAGVVGALYPRRVAVMNTGTANLLISKAEHSGSNAFTFTDTARLPHLLEPGASIELQILFAPTEPGPDTAYLTWISNAEGTKTRSMLTGRGLRGGLEWSDSLLELGTRSNASDTIHLTNPVSVDLGGPVNVESLDVSGPDAMDFRVTANELGYEPLQSFPVAPEESVWFVVTFAPDTTRSKADRHAVLTASDLSGYHPQAQLLGRIGTAGLHEFNEPGFALHQDERSLNLSLRNGPWTIEIMDALGRRLLQQHCSGPSASMDISALPAGSYYLRAASPYTVVTTRLQIVR